MLGREREGLVLSEDDKRLVAYHEAGHAIVAQFTEHADPLFKVTIIPRRRSLGCTKQIPEEEKFNYSREYLLARLQVILGGRAAEHLIFDTFTTGGGDDLKKAKEISHNMVCDYGMSEKIGHVSLGNGDDEVFLGQDIGSQRNYSEKTAEIVDEEISEITSSCFENAVETLKEHREDLDDLAEALIERESLERHEIYEILGLEDELKEEREQKEEQDRDVSQDSEEVNREESEPEASEDPEDVEDELVTGETDSMSRADIAPGDDASDSESDTPQKTTKSMRPSSDDEEETSSRDEADDSNNAPSDDTEREQDEE
jgi:cell division protease FtsH